MQTNSMPEPNAAASAEAPRASANAAAGAPLQLPKGALLAFRQSGGAPTRTREIVIYPDGRISFGGPDVSKEAYARVPRQLNDAQIARIRKMLAHANFFRLESPTGETTPATSTYEIAARAGNRTHALTLLADAVPEPLAPLIQQLSAWMPKE